jgi:PAS domain S-box-containing protein
MGCALPCPSMHHIQLFLLAAVLYNLGLVIVILWRTRPQRAARAFACYIVSITAWIGCIALMQPRYGEAIVLDLSRFTFFCATAIGVCWVWFCATFPRPDRHFLQVARLCALLSLPWLLFVWSNFYVRSISFREGYLESEIGPLVIPFGIWMMSWTICGGIHLYWKAQVGNNLERLQVRYILIGQAGMMLVVSLFNIFLPALTHSTRLSHFGPLASLFVLTTTTIAITRLRLLSIKIVLRAGLVYAITIGSMAVLVALLVPILDTLLATRLNLPTQPVSLVLAFVLSISFQPIRRYVQTQVEKRFVFHGVFDHRLLLREASQALASARDRIQVSERLVTAVTRILDTHRVIVYVPGAAGTFVRTAAVGTDARHQPLLSADSPLLAGVLTGQDIIDVDELFAGPAGVAEVAAQLKAWDIALAVPLTVQGRVCGLVLLGEEKTGEIYTPDDWALLRILCDHAAIALDNSAHYDEIALLTEYHRRLLDIMQDGVVALDPEQRIITINPAAIRIIGITAARAFGHTLAELGLPVFPVTIAEQTVEATMTLSDGRQLPLLIMVTPFRRRQDTRPCHLIVFRDLSDLRALEREKLQVERFSVMGAMAASIAQEIQTPLAPIQTFAAELPHKFDDQQFRESFSHKVGEEVNHINRLISQMLDLVRQPPPGTEQLDVVDLFRRVQLLVAPTCQEQGVHLSIDLSPTLPLVCGALSPLYQAVLALCVNAVQGMPSGGNLLITADHTRSTLRLTLRDTGPDLAADELTLLFDAPQALQRGGGHGLVHAARLIHSQHGEITAAHAPTGGLLLTISLPTVVTFDGHPVPQLVR